MAVGVVFAAASQGAESVSLASAVAVSLGIVIQNIPEGALVFIFFLFLCQIGSYEQNEHTLDRCIAIALTDRVSAIVHLCRTSS